MKIAKNVERDIKGKLKVKKERNFLAFSKFIYLMCDSAI